MLDPELALAAARVKAHLLNSIAAEFYARRQELNEAEADVAGRAGTSQSRFSELERGNGNPTVESLARVAAALGLEIDVVVRPARERSVQPDGDRMAGRRARSTRPSSVRAEKPLRQVAGGHR